MSTRQFLVNESSVGVCRRCSKEFLKKRSDQLECGCKLIRLGELKPKKCGICKNIFNPKQRNSKYCSVKCGKKYDYKKHRKQYIRKRKEWYENNKELALKQRRDYYWANPEYWRAKAIEYRKSHLKEVKERNESYKDNVRHGGIRKKLLKKSNFKCNLCGADTRNGFRNSVAHHKTFNPKDHRNQELLCRSCHAKIHHG